MNRGSDDLVPLLDAVAIARDAGYRCDIVQLVSWGPQEILVSVTTTDPDPTVAAIEQGQRGSTLLSEHDQSGPERWDYSWQREVAREQLAIRLTGEHGSTLVMCMPIAFAHLATFGWQEATGDPIPVFVSREALGTTLLSLTGVQNAEHG
jgi:hypothetical protein